MAQLRVTKWKPFDHDYQGKAAVIKKSPGSVYAFDKKGQFILLYKNYTKGAVIGMSSGQSVEMSDGITYFLITLKNQFREYEFGYVSRQDFYFSTAKAEDERKAKDDAQVLLTNLLANDRDLLKKINTQYELVKRLKAKGKNVAAQEALLKKVASAWVIRQKAVASNPLIQITKKIAGPPEGIGVVPLIVWGLAIGAGTVLVGITVYYFLKPQYNTSQLHSKYIEENETQLRALLGDEKFEELKKSVDGEIKENAQEAYDEGKGEGLMNILKPLAIGVLGFLAISKFQSSGKG